MLIFDILLEHKTSEITRFTTYEKVIRYATHFYVSCRVSS